MTEVSEEAARRYAIEMLLQKREVTRGGLLLVDLTGDEQAGIIIDEVKTDG